MKRLFFFAALFFLTAAAAFSTSVVLPPYQETNAYKQYQRRPKSELSKLVYLMDRFKGSAYTVIFNQVEYDSEVALKHAKSYIAKNYDKENASEWIKEHSYRSPSGQIIYLKDPDGKTQPLRDALISELKRIV